MDRLKIYKEPMFVAKLNTHATGYGPGIVPESWDCPLCSFNVYPDTDPDWIRNEVTMHLIETHRADPDRIKIRRRKPKKVKDGRSRKR